jgi:phospholipid/cholesterol/gamma-HCH transport system substrate-binding protein
VENRAYAIATGVFVLLMGALLCGAVFWLSGGAPRGLPYDLITEDSVAGLAKGAQVKLRGVEIGEVKSIGFDPQNRRLVRVRALLDPRVPLMVGTQASQKSAGISGSDYVELNYPDSATRALETSRSSPATIPLRTSDFGQLTDSGDQVLQSLQDTLHRVDAVLTPELAQHVGQLVTQLNQAAVQITLLGHDLRPAAQRLAPLLDDTRDTVRTARTALQDADTLVVQVRARVNTLDTLRETLHDTGDAVRDVHHALVDETLPRVDSLADRLSGTSDTLDQLLIELQNQPQSVIFGLPPPRPGPGESGMRTASK